MQCAVSGCEYNDVCSGCDGVDAQHRRYHPRCRALSNDADRAWRTVDADESHAPLCAYFAIKVIHARCVACVPISC
jgi:hypothetical protein